MRGLPILLLALVPGICAAQNAYQRANDKMNTCESVALGVAVYAQSVRQKERLPYDWKYPKGMLSMIAMRASRTQDFSADFDGSKAKRWGWAWCMDNYDKSPLPLDSEEYDDILRGGAPKKPKPKY